MLDRTFAALADPTRRAIVAKLIDGRPLAVGEIARTFPMSLPAVIKHLDILTDAGLVTRTRVGRNVQCRPYPGANGRSGGLAHQASEVLGRASRRAAGLDRGEEA